VDREKYMHFGWFGGNVYIREGTSQELENVEVPKMLPALLDNATGYTMEDSLKL
jgi:hypothetical protein